MWSVVSQVEEKNSFVAVHQVQALAIKFLVKKNVRAYMHAVVVELKLLWKQLSIHEYFIIVALSSAEAPAGHPNKNSNNQKIESGRGKMVFSFSLSPALPKGLCWGESHCRKTQIQYFYRLSNHQTMLLKGSIGSCQRSVTVEPRYNKPLNDEVLGITNDFLYPSVSEILLVCTWCHGGHVGDQEQKHFSPLGTKLYFHVNSSKKNFYCIDPQHGCLVTWLQTKNMKKKLDITKSCHSKHVLPFPWPFVWSKFHCIMLIRRLKRVVRIGTFHFLSPPPKDDRNLKPQIFVSVLWKIESEGFVHCWHL